MRCASVWGFCAHRTPKQAKAPPQPLLLPEDTPHCLAAGGHTSHGACSSALGKSSIPPCLQRNGPGLTNRMTTVSVLSTIGSPQLPAHPSYRFLGIATAMSVKLLLILRHLSWYRLLHPYPNCGVFCTRSSDSMSWGEASIFSPKD